MRRSLITRRSRWVAPLAVVLLPSACTSFGAGSPPSIDRLDGSAEAAISDAEAPLADARMEDAASWGISRAPCGGAVFCDDFERAGVQGPWDKLVLDFSGKLEIVGDAGVDGSAALVASVSGGEGNQQALLLHERGRTSSSVVIRMAFAARLDDVSEKVSGPRLLVALDPAGENRRDVVVVFNAQAVSLAYNASNCPSCGASPADVIPLGPGWHRFALELEGIAGTAPPNLGRILFYVDGRPVVDAALGVPVVEAARLAFDFGITAASAGKRATITFDDAYFESSTK